MPKYGFGKIRTFKGKTFVLYKKYRIDIIIRDLTSVHNDIDQLKDTHNYRLLKGNYVVWSCPPYEHYYLYIRPKEPRLKIRWEEYHFSVPMSATFIDYYNRIFWSNSTPLYKEVNENE